MSELAQALIALDGQIGLVAQDGNFLGLICSDPNHPNSIINPDTYANPYGNTVYNHNSPYGGIHGLQSPCNDSCLNPPILMDINDKHIALVTRNYSLVGDVSDTIDIDFILGILYGLSHQKRYSSNEYFDDAYNLMAQEIEAEQAMQLGNIYAESYRNQYQTSATLMASILNRRPAY
jgi:hypothetical protein